MTLVGYQFVERRGSNIRSKVEMFIDDILNFLYGLDERGQLPKIIPRMPLFAVMEGDNVEVSTRLGSMEKEIIELKTVVTKMAAGDVTVRRVINPIPPLAVVGEEAGVGGVVIGGGQGHLNDAGVQPSWSQVAGNSKSR